MINLTFEPNLVSFFKICGWHRLQIHGDGKQASRASGEDNSCQSSCPGSFRRAHEEPDQVDRAFRRFD